MDLLSRITIKLTKGRIAKRRPLDRIPRVTVVIPCYNYGRYLHQCVKSVTTEQPGIEVEVIIVDDKSTDDSLEVALQIQENDPRVRVVRHEQNRGHIATYNHGLGLATGEFVLLLSADDLVTPGALSRAAELLVAEPSVGMVYGNAIHFCDEVPASRKSQAEWIIWDGIDWLRDRCQAGYNLIASPEAVMRTSILKQYGGYRADLPHAGDFEMWLRTSAVSDIGFLKGVDQAYYRHHTNNMNTREFSSGTDQGRLIDLKQRLMCFEAVFASTGKNLAEGPQLLAIARQTLARETLEKVNYAYARGFRDFPVAEFETAARQFYPASENSKAAKILKRQKKFGMISLPLHPLWAIPVFGMRVRALVRSWSLRGIGL